MKPLLTGIYTLTPTHCGTGQASDAIDLPIAREVTTGCPIIPATSLKGAARAALDDGSNRDLISKFFGPDIKRPESTGTPDSPQNDRETEAEGAAAGWLSFGEGQLLVYPFRSLRPPLAFATCPLLLERLARALRARKFPSGSGFLKVLSGPAWESGRRELRDSRTLLRANPTGPLVLEDRLMPQSAQAVSPIVEALGKELRQLLPEDEAETRDRLEENLFILPDALFLELVRRCTPVNARVKLTSGKTTSEYMGENGMEKGNLWYEETLPPDCLFWCLIEPRPGGTPEQRAQILKLSPPNADASKDKNRQNVPALLERLRTTQIGGNETVGQGMCLWTIGRTA